MTIVGPRFISRLVALAVLLALLTAAPAVSAQDEPAFVLPCADGFEWEAAAGQPIAFFCGWGVQGGPGKIVTFLKAHRATLMVENEQGQVVLSIDAATFATLWGDPNSGPSGFDDITCAGPTGRGVAWMYVLDAGLPAGTYTVTLDESLRHPVNDGFHTCRDSEGQRLASPPSLFRGAWQAVGTIIVED